MSAFGRGKWDVRLVGVRVAQEHAQRRGQLRRGQIPGRWQPSRDEKFQGPARDRTGLLRECLAGTPPAPQGWEHELTACSPWASRGSVRSEEVGMQRHSIFTAQRRGSTPSPARRRKVFICYSHKDQRWLDGLLVHLAPLERQRIEVWSDTRIDPGNQWRRKIRRAIDGSMAAVLLVSGDFLASDFIVQDELPPLLRAAETRGLLVLCLIIRFCAFADTPLARFQTINRPSEPLNKLPVWRQDMYFLRTYSAIRDAMS
jgi:hypothetical protein